MNRELENAIGKTLDETKKLNWADCWPVVDENMVIVDVVDEYSDDDILLVETMNGYEEVPHGQYFDAIRR